MNAGLGKILSPERVLLGADDLSALMPQHLLVDAQGLLLGAGPTTRKILPGNARFLHDAFVITRPITAAPIAELLSELVESSDRIELRLTADAKVRLRGQVVRLADDMFLLDLGFGMTLPEAVRRLKLDEGDFAASSLAMEFLFLHEANHGILRELSLFNTRLNDARSEAEDRAYTDPLTGLRNRRGLELALDMALHATRGSEEARGFGGFAVAQVDLDHFKAVNDLYGHAAGDDVLRHVARVLGEAIRDGDVAARTGGDEFVLILHGATNHRALRKLGQRIISEIRKPIESGPNLCHVAASIGLTISSNYDDPIAEQLLADADMALYESKRAGRGKVTILTGSLPPATPLRPVTK
ncbi:GGDEF domain-containing protein [Paracoccus methylarcula]|uniref:GGDEF domain-containing protein n=1 Tax=Paracoccus methylarcula TaxID=72022 RepID=A0A3R7M7T0_9RHOB|nr:GGDEF domain-containing protein [Paracoccus methylarcula]RNF33382.1 GGDEF domain-containing protein [Paracoccus methylarcula]